MYLDINRKRFVVSEKPDICPRCHHGIESVDIDLSLVKFDHLRGPWVQAIYKCPRIDCSELFIANYQANADPRGGYDTDLIIFNIEPINPDSPDFPEDLETLSPDYIEIYTQSFFAEQHGLDQLAGMGYRKALEFLVKDYLISVLPDNEEEIRASFLSRVINNHVRSERIKACAERAAWLGNDEAHYERKWKSHDIEDLKSLLNLTANWILTEIQTEQYLKDMER